MSIQFTNPWGKTSDYDAQRNDLFLFDIGQVSASIKAIPDVSKVPGIDALPTADSGWVYGTLVDLPIRTVDSNEFLSGGVPRRLPGYTQPPSGLKVVFIIDQDGALTQPRILAFLSVWRALVRIGRPSPYGGPSILLSSATSKPAYKFDLPLYGFEGAADYRNTTNPVVSSHQWTLKACWPMEQEPETLTYDKSEMLKISVTFACASLLYAGGVGHTDALDEATTGSS